MGTIQDVYCHHCYSVLSWHLQPMKLDKKRINQEYGNKKGKKNIIILFTTFLIVCIENLQTVRTSKVKHDQITKIYSIYIQ